MLGRYKHLADSTGIYDGVSLEYRLIAIRLINFKAFSDSGWINLNKLTLLLGANSSGKSSILQFFELLRTCHDMLKRADYFTNLGKLSPNYGEFDELRNLNSSNENIVFSFKFENVVYKEDVVNYSITLSGDDKGAVSRITLEDEEAHTTVLPWDIPTYDPVNIFFWWLKDCNALTHSLVGCKMNGIQSALVKFAENINMLQPQRISPTRNMSYSGGSNLALGDFGQNTYQLLFNAFMDDNKDVQCLDMVNAWLRNFGYSFNFKLYKPNQGEFLLRNLKTGKETNIVDNGFGISQSLPVIIALSKHSDGLLMIDSPEAFLQTDMQAAMADYIIAGADKGSMLLEIASEYILIRMQRRIAEGKIKNDDISLYYIYDSKNGNTRIEEVKIDADGSFMQPSEAFAEFFSSNYQDILSWENAKRKRLLKV